MAWTYNITDRPQSHYSYQNNAIEVYNWLYLRGYSFEAIIGVLANMEHESYINLGQQELYRGGDTSYGYGLVQWTPARTKILQFAQETGGNWYDGQVQMDYFDINVPASWIKTKNYPYSFNQYKYLTDIYTATRTFFYNFERGTYTSALDTYAEYWSKYFGEEPPEPPEPPTPSEPTDEQKLFFLMSKKRSFQFKW